jgi:hypothetical protein
MFSTDPAVRAQFIDGLRQLADFLDVHLDVPVPPYGDTISVHAHLTDQGGKDEVNAAADLLGTPVYDDITQGGHYWTARSFGPIGYHVTAVSDTAYRQHLADSTYRGCVTPDTWTASA